jgi:3-hydroxyphenylacetate 6-hydroxylase
VESYIPHLDKETRVFLAEAFSYGDAGKKGIDPAPLFLRMNLSIGLTLHWGNRMESQSDLFREIIHVEDVISNFRSTTGNLQDYIPPLRLNPFSSNSSMAADMRIRRDKYMHGLDHDLNEKMERGEHKPCIRANVKQDGEAKLSDLELTSLNLTLLAAGLDTMNSAVNWGIAMLATNQDVQNNAVAAIRETYADDQPLGDANDQQTCQYLVVMIKEILR